MYLITIIIKYYHHNDIIILALYNIYKLLNTILN